MYASRLSTSSTMKSLNMLKGLSTEEVMLVLILGAGSFMLMSNLSSIAVALPHIQRDFDSSLSTIKWVSIVGFIVAASLSLCFGRVGDIYGRRSVYRAGIGVYTLGAGLCTVAPSLETLIASRVVMAVGLGMASPLSAAIIAATVTPERRGQVVGLLVSFAAAGQLMGPTLGGFILELSNWRGIFLFNFGLALSLCLVQALFLRGTDERRPGTLDVLGALLLLGAYPALLIGLSTGPTQGWSASPTLIWFGLAALGFLAFAWREYSFASPLVSFRLLGSPALCLALFLLSITAFVQNPMTIFVPVYLQNALTLDAFNVGLLMMALPLSTLIAGPLGGRLADRYLPQLVAGVGVALLCIAVVAYGRMGISTTPVLILVPLVLAGTAGGLSRPATQVAAFQTVRPGDFGSVSAMQTSLMMLAGTLGTTVTVAISDSVSTGTDAASFVSAQQTTFLALVPLLLTGLAVSLISSLRRSKDAVTSTTLRHRELSEPEEA
jgi:EmrB/QacA subfamily drug resistance transporter